MSAAVATHQPSMDLTPHKRKRSRSRSSDDGPPPSTRRRSFSPPPPRGIVDIPMVEDVDPVRRAERERQLAARLAPEEGETKEKEFDAMAEFAKLTSSRSGGVYMPPARLRALQAAAAQDRSSAEYQRLSWDALRKSITGIVNRVNVGNIKHVVPELFSENLIRGRGLFARSIMKAQAASLPFTPVFAALVSIINTKLPMVGELLLHRLVSQFRRAFKRNDKTVCHSTTTFIGHLVNQAVAHELIALQILDNSPKANATVFERFRAVLNEGNISHRVQYMIEVLMQEEEQITHEIQLEEDLKVEEGLNIFKVDPNFLENEEKYKGIKAEILGEGSSDDDEDDDEGGHRRPHRNEPVNLRRVIYLTIMNALNYEEAVHKLLKVQLKEGEEIELVNMIIECCSQERSYSNFYGLVSERFCKLNRVWNECYERAFETYFETIHRYETNRLRNIARLFGHLIANDAMSWAVLQVIKMNEDDTTSSSRIFVKIMMQEVTESMGLPTLKQRFADPEIKALCTGMFPLDNPKNTRFAINYFTSIGLGAVTEEMREHLKNAPRLIMEQRRAMLEAESSSSDTSSDTDSSSDITSSDSDGESDASDGTRDRRSPRRSASPPRHFRRDSPPRRGRDDSRSPSPPRRPRRDSPRRGRDDSRSPSPPPPRRPRRTHPSVTISSPRRLRRDSPRRAPKRDDSRTPSPPPRSRRDDDDRGGYGRDRRESPARYRRRSDSVSRSPPPPRGRYERERERSPPPPRRESARDRDRDRRSRSPSRSRSRDYDRRRDDSRDRYRDRRR
ncbi:hypothetical protein BJV77DRAFT_978730 [Russula vinacea]|nr:hypothetical protein BJV77DRAFT_978730 [Russula vinacea]